jgi:hypothetical protein
MQQQAGMALCCQTVTVTYWHVAHCTTNVTASA